MSDFAKENPPPDAELAAAVRGVLEANVAEGGEVAVALSGGMDSASLLHVAAGVAGGDWRLSACYVNHGISRNADAWERFCRRLCDSVGVPLIVKKAAAPGGEVGEDWARKQRLRAFAELPCAAIVAAHHSGDQAETVLFRLLRGAGPGGMSAMRRCSRLPIVDGGGGAKRQLLLRPWLDIPRARIAEYARKHRLRWIEDEDNRNLARRRNFLRWRALPMMAGGGFDCESLLPMAARRFASGANLLASLARLDEDAAAADVGGARGFRAAYFYEVGEARTCNWLHDSLRRRGGRFSERAAAEAARQIFNAAANGGDTGGARKSLLLDFGNVSLREWRGCLFWDDSPKPPAAFYRPLSLPAIGAAEGDVRMDFPELGGALIWSARRGEGVSVDAVGDGFGACLRRGGETIRPRGRSRQSAAELMRAAGLPPWRRARLPFICVGGGSEVAAIPGIAVADAHAAKPGEQGWHCLFEWYPCLVSPVHR